MKTSKIILISFFSIIALLLLSLSIEGYIYNDKKKYKRDEYGQRGDDYKSIRLTKNFNHIKVSKHCNILVIKGSSSLTYLPEKSGTFVPEYEIKDDTLFIKSTTTKVLTVAVKENVKTVSAESAEVMLSLNLPSLSLDFKSVKANINNVKISKFDICLKDHTTLRMHDFYTDTIKMNIDNSEFYCSPNSYNKIEMLSGMIGKGSQVYLPNAMHFDLHVDKTSKLSVYTE